MPERQKGEKMIPNKCPHCGAPVNMARAICEYCGTTFENEAVRIVYGEPKVDRLSAMVSLGDEMFAIRDANLTDLSKYAIELLSKKIAEGLIPYMQIETSHDMMHMAHNFRADIRVVRPGVRF